MFTGQATQREVMRIAKDATVSRLIEKIETKKKVKRGALTVSCGGKELTRFSEQQKCQAMTDFGIEAGHEVTVRIAI